MQFMGEPRYVACVRVTGVVATELASLAHLPVPQSVLKTQSNNIGFTELDITIA